MDISEGRAAIDHAAEKLKNWGRWGVDVIAGRFPGPALRYSDDALNMPIQAATHWDSLGHIFLDESMYNGHHARIVDSGGVHKLGIEHTRARMVGHGVLLDVPRHKRVDWLPDGYGIANAALDATARPERRDQPRRFRR